MNKFTLNSASFSVDSHWHSTAVNVQNNKSIWKPWDLGGETVSILYVTKNPRQLNWPPPKWPRVSRTLISDPIRGTATDSGINTSYPGWAQEIWRATSLYLRTQSMPSTEGEASMCKNREAAKSDWPQSTHLMRCRSGLLKNEEIKHWLSCSPLHGSDHKLYKSIHTPTHATLTLFFFLKIIPWEENQTFEMISKRVGGMFLHIKKHTHPQTQQEH